jgi:hypothetical protein
MKNEEKIGTNTQHGRGEGQTISPAPPQVPEEISYEQRLKWKIEDMSRENARLRALLAKENQ